MSKISLSYSVAKYSPKKRILGMYPPSGAYLESSGSSSSSTLTMTNFFDRSIRSPTLGLLLNSRLSPAVEKRYKLYKNNR